MNDCTHQNTLNINVGLIGHVDSGKTTLAKALSMIASTAAFDKNPQSKERGITIDLGFSSFIIDINEKLKKNEYLNDKKYLQFTLVDCPGHASLLKTLIGYFNLRFKNKIKGGSKIMDFALCIVDITHGIQTQTAECILLTEILKIPIIVVLTKLDLVLIKEKDKIDKVFLILKYFTL